MGFFAKFFWKKKLGLKTQVLKNIIEDEGVDEILLPTLAISDVGFPGGYSPICLPKRNYFISR